MSIKRKLTQFSLPVTIFKEGRFFIAYTPLLDLSVQGKTEFEARRRFVEVVKLFFEELEEMGTAAEVGKVFASARLREGSAESESHFLPQARFKLRGCEENQSRCRHGRRQKNASA